MLHIYGFRNASPGWLVAILLGGAPRVQAEDGQVIAPQVTLAIQPNYGPCDQPVAFSSGGFAPVTAPVDEVYSIARRSCGSRDGEAPSDGPILGSRSRHRARCRGAPATRRAIAHAVPATCRGPSTLAMPAHGSPTCALATRVLRV